MVLMSRDGGNGERNNTGDNTNNSDVVTAFHFMLIEEVRHDR